MRIPIIAANWKMNKTPEQAVTFIRELQGDLDIIKGIDKVICPSFIAIPSVYDVLKGTTIALGAQNMHYEEQGAFTGECAPNMIAPFCQYVIIGHSERRAYFGETNESVNRKVKAALTHGLTPIICVGESLEQNEAGETQSFVSNQVQIAFADLSAEQVKGCVIAYEPIWAIGTGKSASPAEAGNIIGLSVRATIAELYGDEIAYSVRVQYGGSANEHNIGEFIAHPDIDGALVGGASLKSSFVQLVRNAV